MTKKVLKILTFVILSTFWTLPAFAQLCTPEGQLTGELGRIINNIKTTLLALGTIIAGIFIIIGAYRFITAGGSAEEVEKAKKQITFALVGVAIILLSEALVRIVRQILCR